MSMKFVDKWTDLPSPKSFDVLAGPQANNFKHNNDQIQP